MTIKYGQINGERKTAAFIISDKIAEYLERLANEDNVSKSAILRQIIEEHMQAANERDE